MATLAIKGHPTRGKEVIQLLEMLGGNNIYNHDGTSNECYTFANDEICAICTSVAKKTNNYVIFTLEEFERKFPYKVGDCVVNHKYGKGDITQMLWIDDEIVYEIHFEDYMAYCKANELCKYDAFKGLLLQELTEYLSHATREELDKTMEEIEIALAPFKVGDKVIVKGYEKMDEDEVICVFKTYFGDIKYKTKNHLDTHYFMEDSLTRVKKSNKEENMRKRTKIVDLNPKLVGERKVKLVIPHDWEIKEENGEIFLQDKRSQYPKIYEECCKVLGYEGGATVIGYDAVLLNSFQKLKLCRDAYWKIAGEQMGLDKAWEPDWENKTCHTISYDGVNIKCYYYTDVYSKFAFPTAEMRDAFFGNFKELINETKELL